MAGQQRRWFSFDPTIHAGHVMTAGTIVICAIASWMSVQHDITDLKKGAAVRDQRITKAEERTESTRRESYDKIDRLTESNNATLEKLRDDMNSWFMLLNDKLDRKADKP